MTKTRKRFKADFKAKVALEASKEIKTTNQIAQEFGLHPNQITSWKKVLQERSVELFGAKDDKEKQDSEALIPLLYQEIGQLKMELDWLKKKLQV